MTAAACLQQQQQQQQQQHSQVRCPGLVHPIILQSLNNSTGKHRKKKVESSMIVRRHTFRLACFSFASLRLFMSPNELPRPTDCTPPGPLAPMPIIGVDCAACAWRAFPDGPAEEHSKHMASTSPFIISCSDNNLQKLQTNVK